MAADGGRAPDVLIRHALGLARRNLGQTWPNPAVGAVVVKNGEIVGQGWTGRGGRPHAETQALAQAGEQASDASMAVSLEPCAHIGQTPPCVDAIIRAGIRSVIVACRDPNPKVNGRGIARLRDAGIEVTENVCHTEAERMNAGFFSVQRRGRPFVSLKIATSQDHKITRPEGRWITGPRARDYGQLLRSEHDAILTGSGTALADDPLLTCRLPGLQSRSPVRIVLDRRLRLPATGRLAQTARQVRTIVMTHACDEKTDRAQKEGVEIMAMPPTLEKALEAIAALGITQLMVEAGRKLASAFLREGLVDRIYWFYAPEIIGAQGLCALEEDLLPPPGLRAFARAGTLPFADDWLEIYEPCSQALSQG